VGALQIPRQREGMQLALAKSSVYPHGTVEKEGGDASCPGEGPSPGLGVA